MPRALIHSIAHAVPPGVLDNASLEARFEDFPADKILSKTGILRRHISGPEVCSSDLACEAAERLFQSEPIARSEVDALIFCTQTPDYFLPTSACLIQDRLGLSRDLAAFDVNLGCSGYVYALGIATGLIESRQAKRILLLTGDTYSKLLAEDDRGVRSIFGDAASATLVVASDTEDQGIGPFVYGTDGRGGSRLAVEGGAFRAPGAPRLLRMDGPAIFNFTLSEVPGLVDRLLLAAGLSSTDIDLFVFHQANRFMLEHLQRKLGIPGERFLLEMEWCGNTVSSSIPIALSGAQRAGRLRPGMTLMLVGFGVGLSWGATLVKWAGTPSGAADQPHPDHSTRA
jgi:3-oxoacyl-[acyl-carrier-protein] synthase-3